MLNRLILFLNKHPIFDWTEYTLQIYRQDSYAKLILQIIHFQTDLHAFHLQIEFYTLWLFYASSFHQIHMSIQKSTASKVPTWSEFVL